MRVTASSKTSKSESSDFWLYEVIFTDLEYLPTAVCTLKNFLIERLPL